MILVVALLGILFVAGVAFLQTVTFQSKAIQAETDTREDEAVVDAVEDLVISAMTRSWMGENGVPYRGAGKLLYEVPNSGGTLRELESWINYGETPGVSSLLAGIEPFEGVFQDDAERLVWGAHTDLRLLMNDRLVPQRNSEFPADRARPNWDWEVGSIDIYQDGPPDDDLVDADGDGIADSVGVTLSLLDLIPSAQWDETVNRLRAPDGTTDDITVGVRVVSHGGMVNPNYSHPLLVDEVWNDALPLQWDTSGNRSFVPGQYAPEIEEQALRHRSLMPSRMLPDTLLQQDLRTRLFANVSPLVGMFQPQSGTTGDFADHRWWPFDAAAEDPTLGNIGGGPFRRMMDPNPTVADPYVVTDAARYDRRHLTTTISYDDLLICGVQFPEGHPAAGQDVVEWMKADTDRRKLFHLDNYPYLPNPPSLRLTGASEADENAGMVGSAIDGRVGRIQLSLPFLDDWLAAPPNNTTLDGLASIADTDPRKQRFIGMIRDMFWVMLWNSPDFNRDGSYAYDATYAAGSDDFDRAVTAASLTANLIDFADSDDEPTRVMAVDGNGNSLNREVYGLERQPFITEVVSIMPGMVGGATPGAPDHANIIYAVELFNPYVTALPVPANRYKIVFNDPANPRPYDVPQLALGIPAGGFVTFFATDNPSPGGLLPPGAVNLGNLSPLPQTPFGPTTVVELVRTINATDIVVDRFDVSAGGAVEFGGQTATPNIGPASIQRDADPADPLRRWRAVVPIVGPEDTNAHTLSAPNTYVNVNIRPVQADVSNAGSLADAYPTTGTLLLLMRHAHLYDTSAVPPGTPFNQVGATAQTGGSSAFPTDLATRFDQIDNGRMPAFDVGDTGASVAGSKPYYHTSPKDYITLTGWSGYPRGPASLPWGLLVFDYFTALPLETNPADFEQLLYSIDYPPTDYVKPKVDQAGLRVYGRIDVNVAPWKVLTGLPLIAGKDLPGAGPTITGPTSSFFDKLKSVYPSDDTNNTDWFDKCQTALGWQAARAIVAYRDGLNNFPVGCSGEFCPGDYRDRIEGPFDEPTTPYLLGMRQGKGFLSIGELANVRHPDRLTDRPIFRIDNGAVGSGVAAGNPTEDYVEGVALLVALGDWVTTRSHVFTIYGTIRGDGSDPTEVDRRAIRFETTVDRLPTFFDHKASPQRIGQRTIGRYLEARTD